MVDYMWRAYYNDNSYMEQFENGVEHTFQDIDQDRLQMFEVFTAENVPVRTFGIVLDNGQFYINNCILNEAPDFNTEKHKLVYFRRRRETTSPIGPIASNTVHVLGFESHDFDDKVYNHMYIIDEEGRGVVRLHKK
jgi:hypothetical protein